MKAHVNPHIFKDPDGIACVRFELTQQHPAIIGGLSFFNSGNIALHVKEQLPDHVLWFGLGFMISLELSRDMTSIQVIPARQMPGIDQHEILPAEVFSELEYICSEAKKFFIDTASGYWNSPVQDCCIRHGNVQWHSKSLSLGFDQLVDLALEKQYTARCA